MYRDSLTAAIRRQTPRRYALLMAMLLALVFVASVASVELRLPGSETAPWWPAAGIGVFAVLSARGWGFAVAAMILVVTAAANLVAGTVWWVAIGFGIANAVEAWLVGAIMRFRRRPGRRFRHGDSLRFLGAIDAGAVLAAAIVGGVVALNGGDMFATAVHIAASHASAVLLISVLGLVPLASFIPRKPIDLAVQLVALGITIALAFGPFEHLPLAFLPIPVIAAAAFRFTSGVTLVEVALATITVAVLSFNGSGPFAIVAADDTNLLIGLIQVFSLSLGTALVPIAVAQDDRSDLYWRLSAREQVLRGAIVSAHAGFVVVRREAGGVNRVVEANPNGERLLASWLTTENESMTIDGARIAEITAPGADGSPNGIEFPGGVLLDLTASPVVGDKSLLLIQAIDITEQRKAAQALADAFVHEREAADRLRELAAEKDEFLASVSHELRTPVTSILGYTEDLSEADLPANERRSVEVISRNAQRLAVLVEDLLSLSTRAGPAPSASTAVDVGSAITDCVEELSGIAARARVTIEVRAGDDCVIAGDRLGLDRILVNLLANAIKFTPPGGRIDITVTAAVNGFARLEVTDTGRGIPPGEIEKVFERFHRVPDEEFVAGTGLGLPIVRDLATRMGGRVELRSDGRTGTTAIVELPLHARSPAPAV